MSDLNNAEMWREFAANDLLVAKHVFTDLYPKQLNISCFLCQQSAEKAFKAFLLSRGKEPPRTHDLELLCKTSAEQDASFATILAISAKLSVYGVRAKYPSELPVDETITKINIDRAQQIYDFCVRKMGNC
jgi:HEPN domain-containing protein